MSNTRKRHSPHFRVANGRPPFEGRLPPSERAIGQAMLGRHAERLIERREYAQAESVLLDAIMAVPLNPYFYTKLIELYGRQSRLDKAREVLSRAEAIGVADAFAYNAMIAAFDKAGRLAQASEIFRIARKNGLADYATYATLLGAHYRAKNFGAILAIIKDAPHSIQSTPGMVRMKANTLRKLERYQEALGCVEQYLRDGALSDNDRHMLLTAKAGVLMNMGPAQKEEAIGLLRALEREVPQDSYHYKVIVCRLVFAGAVAEHEVPKYRFLLGEWLGEKLGINTRKDVEHALHMLGKAGQVV